MRKYQSMWNAEVLHSINPKKPSDLAANLKKIEQAEREEKKRALMNGAASDKDHMKKLNATIQSGNQKISSGNASFDKKLKSNFDLMTADIQARMKRNVASKSVPVETSSVAEPVDEAHNRCKTIFSNEENEKSETAPTAPTTSRIEMVDVDSYCDSPYENVGYSTIAVDKEFKSSPSPTTSTPTPKTRFSSSNQSYLTHHENSSTARQDTRTRKKRKSSSASLATNRLDWACNKCTYVNQGLDYLCQMCGNRKI